MIVLIGTGQTEHHRDLREKGRLIVFFMIVAGFENHAVYAGLHLLIRRIERSNPALPVSGSPGQPDPLFPLLFLNTSGRYTGLQIQHVHAQRIFLSPRQSRSH